MAQWHNYTESCRKCYSSELPAKLSQVHFDTSAFAKHIFVDKTEWNDFNYNIFHRIPAAFEMRILTRLVNQYSAQNLL